MLAVALGIIIAVYLPLLPNPYLISLAGIVVELFRRYAPSSPRGYRQAILRYAVLLALGLAYGAAWGQFRLSQQWPASLAGQDVEAKLEILSSPERRSGGRPQYRFDARLVAGQCVGKTHCPPGRSKLRLNWYGQNPPTLGEQRRLTLRLWPPDGRHSPGAFDYQRWLWSSGYAATGYVRADSTVENVQSNPAGPHFWRARLLQFMTPRLEGLTQRGLIKALLFADRSAMTQADWQRFSRTGTSHLMAISGMHLGIVFAWVILLTRMLLPLSRGGSRWRRFSVMPAWLAAAAYALLAGFSLPTQRALIMLSVLVVAQLLSRAMSASRGLVLALLLVLLADPMASHSAGFALSFGAVAILLFSFSGQRSAQQSRFDGLIRLLKAQWVLGLGLLPISLSLGFWVSSLALPANLLAIPAVAMLILPLLLLALLVAPVSTAAADVLLAWGDAALTGLMTYLDWLVRYSPSWQPALPPLLLPMLAIAVLIVLLPRGVPGKALVVLLLPLLMLWPKPGPESGQFAVSVLDVGQGLSVLVETRHHRLLYDVGPDFDSGFNSVDGIVMPFLRRRGINSLDALVISHGDRDHAGSLPALLEHLPRQSLFAGELTRLPAAMVGADVELSDCHRGQSWQWDGVRFHFLSVPEQLVQQGNNRSCVLSITGPTASALISGDIEDEIEQRLLAIYPRQLGADLLVAPHHGSLSSSSEDFIAAVAAEQVVFAASQYNRYRHPRPEVVARYCATAAAWQTGLHGSLRFASALEGGMEVEQSRLRRRFWQRQYPQLCANPQKAP